VYAWNGKGYALTGLKRYDQALFAFDQALHLNPEGTAVWSLTAQVLWALGRDSEAEEAELQAERQARSPQM
jgi:tetratricopeptide (TPR) repeat protein